MGSCTCWLTPINEISSLQNSRKLIEATPMHIPNMHPKIYTLAEKVFSNTSESVFKVDLSDREIGDESARYLSAILPYLCRLIFLSLQCTKISDTSWEQLLLSLEEISCLKHLNLSKNPLTENNIEILSRGLSKSTELEALILDSVGIYSTGMASLSASIACMRNLKILALSGNSLGDAGVMYLSNVLSYVPQLQFLDLDKNSFTHSCTPYLAGGLGNLTVLKVLKIGDNSVGDEGFCVVIKAVRKSIEELALQGMGISEGGLRELCNRLPELKELRHLQLDYNNIDYKSSKMLIDILPVLNLRYLSLVGCDVSLHRKALSLAHSCTEILI